jgi:NADPH-dependent ferric siderophore reductase
VVTATETEVRHAYTREVTLPYSALIGWNPSEGDRLLLAGNERSLPCISTILRTLSPKARGQVFVEVQSADDVAQLEAPGRFQVCWLVRDRGQSLQRSVDAWLSEMLPVEGNSDAQVYAWIAGRGRAQTLSSL